MYLKLPFQRGEPDQKRGNLDFLLMDLIILFSELCKMTSIPSAKSLDLKFETSHRYGEVGPHQVFGGGNLCSRNRNVYR